MVVQVQVQVQVQSHVSARVNLPRSTLHGAALPALSVAEFYRFSICFSLKWAADNITIMLALSCMGCGVELGVKAVDQLSPRPDHQP